MSARRPTTPSRLAEARLSKGQKQSDVAASLGISQPWYSAIERGSVEPGVRLAQAIAKYFDLSVADLWPSSAEVSR